MRFRSSVVSSLVLVLLLSLAAPLAAAPRDRDEPCWRGPIDRVVRVVKVVKRFFGVSSNGDVMIPPTP
jgi:hypothetical protein